MLFDQHLRNPEPHARASFLRGEVWFQNIAEFVVWNPWPVIAHSNGDVAGIRARSNGYGDKAICNVGLQQRVPGIRYQIDNDLLQLHCIAHDLRIGCGGIDLNAYRLPACVEANQLCHLRDDIVE